MDLKARLEELLPRKKSVQYYADVLGISVTEVEKLKIDIKNGDKGEEYHLGTETRYSADKGTYELKAYYDHPPTPEEVIKDHNIDTSKWKLSAFWSKQKSLGYQVSAFFTSLTQKEEFIDNFTEFLKTFQTSHVPVSKTIKETFYTNTCLIFNKQDAHINKYDLNGNNDITDRFNNLYSKIDRIVKEASIASNVKKIIYVVGSDEFDAEFTETTTKGTPQKTILPYHVSFQAICEHEITVINRLLEYTDELEIIYVPGNHDHYVGWHLISYLKAYFRTQKNLTIDITPDFSKYRKVYNTAVMFNHGDVMKPERMAQVFPIEFKDDWSACDFHIILAGDKHNEMARTIGAIKFYQIPAWSQYCSRWDKQHAWGITKGEVTAFLIEEGNGVVRLFKQPI